MISLLSRYRGCLLGLATGDAVGTTLEFQPPGSFPPLTDLVGGGPFRLRAGEWTDDTSMALCLAESLLTCRGFDPVDQMQRYLRWYREGHLSSNGRCFDIGHTVRSALQQFAATGQPFSGSTDPNSAGNGSLMRLAPVPLYFRAQAGLALAYAVDGSRTTHGAKTCLDACRLLSLLLLGALAGVEKNEILHLPSRASAELGGAEPFGPEIAEIAEGSFLRREPPEIAGTGYVVRSLEAALWAFARGRDFREGCLLAVNLGHDADTTGAIYGQLAGAYYGWEGIPEAWQARLARRALLLDFADRLHSASQSGREKTQAQSGG